MITEIAFFFYPVTDMARVRSFYEQTLGLTVATNWQDIWVEYELKGVAFAISTLDEAHKPGLSGGVLAFEVDDLDAEVSRLKAQGVRFLREIVETPMCRLAFVADPDGNEILLHKRRASADVAAPC